MEKPHKRLEAWKGSLELALSVYKLTDGFPREERFCLVDQTRRAVLSIPSNIAEGAARNTRKEFINFLHMAQGSLSELDTQMEVARRLGYLSEQDWKVLDSQMILIDKMLSGLIRSLRAKRDTTSGTV